MKLKYFQSIDLYQSFNCIHSSLFMCLYLSLSLCTSFCSYFLSIFLPTFSSQQNHIFIILSFLWQNVSCLLVRLLLLYTFLLHDYCTFCLTILQYLLYLKLEEPFSIILAIVFLSFNHLLIGSLTQCPKYFAPILKTFDSLSYSQMVLFLWLLDYEFWSNRPIPWVKVHLLSLSFCLFSTPRYLVPRWLWMIWYERLK